LVVYLEALYGNLFSLRHHAASPCAAQAWAYHGKHTRMARPPAVI